LLSGTHQRIGMTILSSLKQQFEVNLSVDDYLFGCIKPDFSLGAFYTPHLKHKSFDFVLNTIMELGSVPWPTAGKARKAFSMRLGVVMHYLADFFCHAHSTKMGDLMPWHFAYEARLHIVSRKVDLDGLAQELVASLMSRSSVPRRHSSTPIEETRVCLAKFMNGFRILDTCNYTCYTARELRA